MSLRVGEEGKIIRVAAAFDMSSNTDISLTFTDPNAVEVIKTLGLSEITLGAGVTDPDLGVLSANEYVDYPVETGFLVAGSWTVYITYTDTTATPDNIYKGTDKTFTVAA